MKEDQSPSSALLRPPFYSPTPVLLPFTTFLKHKHQGVHHSQNGYHLVVALSALPLPQGRGWKTMAPGLTYLLPVSVQSISKNGFYILKWPKMSKKELSFMTHENFIKFNLY